MNVCGTDLRRVEARGPVKVKRLWRWTLRARDGVRFMAAHGPIVIARLSLVQRIIVVIIAHEKRVVVGRTQLHRALLNVCVLRARDKVRTRQVEQGRFSVNARSRAGTMGGHGAE